MKRNFFKNSLAAFAFTLAIVASFAFTPNESDTVSQYYIQTSLNPNVCDLVEEQIACHDGDTFDCTVGINEDPAYRTRNGIGTICLNRLSKD